ncbi:MAG: PIN domain-containing protein [Rudaea sp.]|uniref:PIN domain-containing protein n=1 Tax=Rudaea sp. TaxID=2136325 RepID=UPI0039E47663
MIALDTNVLVRILVDDADAPHQVAATRARIAAEDAVVVSQSVFLETMWVLERSYGIARRSVCEIAQALLDHPKYRIADHALLADALAILRGAPIGFGDALALAHARANGATLLSFDRKLTRLDGVATV